MTSHALIPAPARLAILGGGLLGRLLALVLSGKGYSIDLYDRGGPQAEHAAAHVAAACCRVVAKHAPVLRSCCFRHQSLPLYMVQR